MRSGSGPMLPVENDCEDQGFSLISDGCLKFECQTWKGRGNRAKRVPTKFVKQRSPGNASLHRGGPLYWVCPKCDGYYGEVFANDIGERS